MDRKWTENRPKIDQKWSKNGQKNGQKMDQKLIKIGQKLAKNTSEGNRNATKLTRKNILTRESCKIDAGN